MGEKLGITTQECHLIRLAGSGNAVDVPPETAQLLGLPSGGKVTLRTGSARLHAEVRTTSSPGVIALTSAALSHLGLTPERSLFYQASQGELRLGPLVGVLAPRRTGHAKPYQAQTSLFKRLMVAAQELGIALYIFDFHDIRWATNRVRGYTYTGGTWISRMYPLPDAIYDRATGSFPGGSGAADIARRKLVKGHKIPLFNTRIGNKLRLHRLMHADPVLRSHLPPTYRLTSSAVVANVLAHHRGAYLKPQNGAQGKGIARLRRTARGIQYTLTTDSYQRVQGTAATAASAIANLRSRGVNSGYLVQPELKLMRINGRICDIRALVQRDADGEWCITGLGVRAGQPGSVVSNLHGGGRALQVEKVLKQALELDDQAVKRIKEEIEYVALQVATVLSRSARCLGELGVDIGIDVNGRVWIIEANSRTGRATFRRAGMPNAAKLADQRPLLFAKYLSGFST